MGVYRNFSGCPKGFMCFGYKPGKYPLGKTFIFAAGGNRLILATKASHAFFPCRGYRHDNFNLIPADTAEFGSIS
jgi:hypothetical protein